jgi:hypothetical protein
MWMGDKSAAAQELISHYRLTDRNVSERRSSIFLNTGVVALRRRPQFAQLGENTFAFDIPVP